MENLDVVLAVLSKSKIIRNEDKLLVFWIFQDIYNSCISVLLEEKIKNEYKKFLINAFGLCIGLYNIYGINNNGYLPPQDFLDELIAFLKMTVIDQTKIIDFVCNDFEVNGKKKIKEYRDEAFIFVDSLQCSLSFKVKVIVNLKQYIQNVCWNYLALYNNLDVFVNKIYPDFIVNLSKEIKMEKEDNLYEIFNLVLKKTIREKFELGVIDLFSFYANISSQRWTEEEKKDLLETVLNEICNITNYDFPSVDNPNLGMNNHI